MSTDIDERIQNIERVLKSARIVRRLYPEAKWTVEGDASFYEDRNAKPNRIARGRDGHMITLIAYEQIGEGVFAPEVRLDDDRGLLLDEALEYMRTEQPAAYAGLLARIVARSRR